ncbi:MAG: hypothetical protein NTW19_22150 [Planctomycetota bacterium]|nr:hypothetical protein [Planctomycetota bacterium]
MDTNPSGESSTHPPYSGLPTRWTIVWRLVATAAFVALVALFPVIEGIERHARWAAGYRTADWQIWELRGIALYFAGSVFALISPFPLALFAIVALRKPWTWTSLVSAALMILVSIIAVRYCFYGGSRSEAFESGRRQAEAEVGVDQLAKDCLEFYERTPNDWIFRDQFEKNPSLPASFRRLRPNYISVYDSSMYLEFHGGHASYGYKIEPDPTTHEWCLLRYWESGEDERLLQLPRSPKARPAAATQPATEPANGS